MTIWEVPIIDIEFCWGLCVYIIVFNNVKYSDTDCPFSTTGSISSVASQYKGLPLEVSYFRILKQDLPRADQFKNLLRPCLINLL